MSVATERHVVGCQRPVEEGSSEDGKPSSLRAFDQVTAEPAVSL